MEKKNPSNRLVAIIPVVLLIVLRVIYHFYNNLNDTDVAISYIVAEIFLIGIWVLVTIVIFVTTIYIFKFFRKEK